MSKREGLTEDEFVALIRRTIDEKFGGVQRDAAKAWKIPEQHVSNVLAGSRKPTGGMQKAFGLRKRAVYASS